MILAVIGILLLWAMFCIFITLSTKNFSHANMKYVLTPIFIGIGCEIADPEVFFFPIARFILGLPWIGGA